MDRLLPNFSSPLRTGSAFLLLTALAFALLFYGVGFNHLFLLVASTCGILALTLCGPGRMLQVWRRRRFAVSLALLLLASLTVHQLCFSISPETSFSIAWILAAAPIWFLVCLMLGEDRVPGEGAADDVQAPVKPRLNHLLPFLLVALAVGVLVWIAAVRFLLFGVRPADPLADPTSFGIMVYLVLVPAVHWWLLPDHDARPSGPIASAACGLFCVSVLLGFTVAFATASRAVIALLALAVCAWVALGVFGKLSLGRAILIAVLAVLAFALASSSSTAVQASVSQDLSGDAAIDQRVLLLDAGMELARRHAPWGAGLYAFSLEYPGIRSPADQTSAGRYVHNDLLQLAAEGGLLLLIPLLLFGLSVGWLLIAGLQKGAGTRADWRMGGALALGLVLIHACVTFVFYTLALSILIGVVSAWCVQGGGGVAATIIGSRKMAARHIAPWLLGILFGWLNLGYLALDTITLAAFSGQPGLPGTAGYRESVEQQRDFARWAQRLNPNRSLPSLFTAIDRSNGLSAQAPEEDFRYALQALEIAMEKDPRNPQGAVTYARVVLQRRAVAEVSPQTMADAGRYLDRALGYFPFDQGLLLAKAHWLDAAGKRSEALELLMSEALPWSEYYWIRSSEDALVLFDEMGRRAQQLGDQAAFEQIKTERARMMARNAADAEPDIWFMRWLRERAG